MNSLVQHFTGAQIPGLVTAAGKQASTRFWEFFVNQIRNVHTRWAYARATGEFLAWCEDHGVASIAEVQPLHVGTYIVKWTRAVGPLEPVS